MVCKLWPEQKFKMKSWLFQKSRADNFRAIKLLRPRCTTRHHGDSLWLVSKNSDQNCRSYVNKKLLTDRRTDGRRGVKHNTTVWAYKNVTFIFDLDMTKEKVLPQGIHIM